VAVRGLSASFRLGKGSANTPPDNARASGYARVLLFGVPHPLAALNDRTVSQPKSFYTDPLYA
jgi:hypothetical protein